MEIEISDRERAEGLMDPGKVAAAVAAFKRDGYVVLLDAIERAELEVLRQKMLEDVEIILGQEPRPYQFVKGHLQQDPPPFLPYLFRDIYYNEPVIAVTGEVLGKGLKLVGVTGNTNLPGSLDQPVHVDSGHLWPDLEEAHPTCDLVVNISPMDVGPQNGATEIWPGSHLDTSIARRDPSIKVPLHRVETRRVLAPPVQLSIPQGGVLIRDMRLWHRGTPNLSDVPRPMIALIMACSWMRGDALQAPIGSEDFFRHSELKIPVEFIDGPIDYLRRHSPYDFQP